MTTPESRVKDAVKKLLKQHGVWYFMPVPTGFGVAGVPDFICCYRGQFIGLECKGHDDSKPTALQAMQMDRIKEAGGRAMLVTPNSLLILAEMFV